MLILTSCLQFIAADKKLSMWLELASFVDFFTIPPVVVTIVTEHTWLGEPLTCIKSIESMF